MLRTAFKSFRILLKVLSVKTIVPIKHTHLLNRDMVNPTDNLDDNFKWIPKVKFTKKKPAIGKEGDFHHNSKTTKTTTAKLPVDNVSIEKSSKHGHEKIKKLKFKGSRYNNGGRLSDEKNTKAISEEVPQQLASDFEVRNDVYDQNFTKRRYKVFQYGNDVNGYKFVAFNEGQIPNSKTNLEEESLSEESNETGISEEDDISPRCPENPDLNFTACYKYTTYRAWWDEAEAGFKCNMLALPVKSNLMDDVTRENVLDFLKIKDVIRKERVRWHPDRMKLILSKKGLWNNMIERNVTHVFQVINDAYESV